MKVVTRSPARCLVWTTVAISALHQTLKRVSAAPGTTFIPVKTSITTSKILLEAESSAAEEPTVLKMLKTLK